MSSLDRFTQRAKKVIALAANEANRLNHDYIGTEHILLGLIMEGGGDAALILKKYKVTVIKVEKALGIGGWSIPHKRRKKQGNLK